MFRECTRTKGRHISTRTHAIRTRDAQRRRHIWPPMASHDNRRDAWVLTDLTHAAAIRCDCCLSTDMSRWLEKKWQLIQPGAQTRHKQQTYPTSRIRPKFPRTRPSPRNATCCASVMVDRAGRTANDVKTCTTCRRTPPGSYMP